ncbi:hypothetical protein LINPERPRIM_LOCUS24891 [Linum perenne]
MPPDGLWSVLHLWDHGGEARDRLRLFSRVRAYVLGQQHALEYSSISWSLPTCLRRPQPILHLIPWLEGL